MACVEERNFVTSIVLCPWDARLPVNAMCMISYAMYILRAVAGQNPHRRLGRKLLTSIEYSPLLNAKMRQMSQDPELVFHKVAVMQKAEAWGPAFNSAYQAPP